MSKISNIKGEKGIIILKSVTLPPVFCFCFLLETLELFSALLFLQPGHYQKYISKDIIAFL